MDKIIIIPYEVLAEFRYKNLDIEKTLLDFQLMVNHLGIKQTQMVAALNSKAYINKLFDSDVGGNTVGDEVLISLWSKQIQDLITIPKDTPVPEYDKIDYEIVSLKEFMVIGLKEGNKSPFHLLRDICKSMCQVRPYPKISLSFWFKAYLDKLKFITL